MKNSGEERSRKRSGRSVLTKRPGHRGETRNRREGREIFVGDGVLCRVKGRCSEGDKRSGNKREKGENRKKTEKGDSPMEEKISAEGKDSKGPVVGKKEGGLRQEKREMKATKEKGQTEKKAE